MPPSVLYRTPSLAPVVITDSSCAAMQDPDEEAFNDSCHVSPLSSENRTVVASVSAQQRFALLDATWITRAGVESFFQPCVLLVV